MSVRRSDSFWMQRCLRLAAKGEGSVSPNPLVGAVIVKGGRLLGEGYHQRYGGPHAEINALEDARRRGADVTGATMYVNLEPCSHHGKTPPCAEALIRSGIRRVVIPMIDPNPRVAGKGVRMLKRHRIPCRIGVCKKNAALLNERFLTFITANRPFIALKAAQSADGFITGPNTADRWITTLQSRREVHRLRARYDAILVGANTVAIDNPELTVRHVKGKNPIRIVLDGKMSVSVRSKIFNAAASTILYTAHNNTAAVRERIKQLRSKGITVVELPAKNGKIAIPAVLDDLASRGISSVLVEGGQRIYKEFLESRSADILYLFTAGKKLRSGLKTFDGISVSFRMFRRRTGRFGSDRFHEYAVRYRPH